MKVKKRQLFPFPHCRWSLNTVQAEKLKIKKELEAIAKEQGHSARLQFALESEHRLEEDFTPSAQLRRYLYAMAALVSHEMEGGLTPSQVKRLERLVLAILKTQGVRPQTSRLADLYSTLDLVISQIHRKSGNHWEALWLQQMAANFPSQGDLHPRQHLALAIRAQRLGYTERALQGYEGALACGLEGAGLYRTNWGRLTVFRLSGDLARAENLLQEMSGYKTLTKAESVELDWQQRCIEVQKTGVLTPLIATVLRGGKHFQPEYRLESALWAFCASSREWVTRLPTSRNLQRSHQLPEGYELLYRTALKIESCYDLDIPLFLRARDLGGVLRRSRQLLHLDHELLAHAAAARWLARVHLFSFASMSLEYYRNLCLQLSGGRNPDVLNQVSDLLNKEWFNPAAASVKKAA